MSCKILTEERWNRILENRLTEEERRELESHLETSCDDCHEFFSRMDVEMEQRLRSAYRNRRSPSDIPAITISDATMAFNGVMTGVDKKQKTGSLAGWLGDFFDFNPQSLGLAGGLAMLVLMIVGPFFQLGEIMEPIHFSKGLTAVSVPSSINLEFATGDRGDDGRLVVARGEVGESYKDSKILFLHYQISKSGFVYLVGYQGSGSYELLYPEKLLHPKRIEAGEYDVPSNDEISGISLHGLKGRYSIAAIYSPTQLDMEDQIIPLVQKSVKEGLINSC